MSILPQKINSSTVFFDHCETHYASSSIINPSDYPQVHDFYEFFLVTEGDLTIILNNERFPLTVGHLLLIRPGDVHSKIDTGPFKHINLAFPSHTIHALFQFLYNSDDKASILYANKQPPLLRLTYIDTFLIQNKLLHLNHFPSTAIAEKNACLRSILVDILFSHVMPSLENPNHNQEDMVLPFWLEQCIHGLLDPTNLTLGMEYLMKVSNRSKEHICRSFRKYLDTTPTAYINAKRLNYAANLLTHTDMEITDIIYESGFQSINYFYHSFKEAYHMSPLKYRNQYHII